MQMLSFRKVRAQCTNVHLRSEKHGETFVPMVDLAIKIETGTGVLSKIEPGLLEFLFRRWMDGDDAHPRALTKQQVANAAGYEASGGGFNNALSKLRTLDLIKGSRELRASPDLFS